MKIHCAILACLPCLLAMPVLAQPQIGGGTCNSSSLSGTYSLTLTGRDLSSSVVFINALQGIGSATFDGLSGVTFTLTNNSNKFSGMAQTLSGTYSLQSNCVGVLNISTGDTASFSLASYNSGSGYLITGQDGVYSFTGSGTKLPASCSVSMLSGTYAFNGNGYALGSSGITGVNYISGLLTFDGTKRGYRHLVRGRQRLDPILIDFRLVYRDVKLYGKRNRNRFVGQRLRPHVHDYFGDRIEFHRQRLKPADNLLRIGANPMKQNRLAFPIFALCLLAAPFLAQAQTTPVTCTVATLTGTHSLVLTGRDLLSTTCPRFHSVLERRRSTARATLRST